jgi:uncharacterized protein (DUF736 family)
MTAKTNTGSLFLNNKKDIAGQPDFKGAVSVGGLEFTLDGWMRQSTSGKQFIALSLAPKINRDLTQSCRRVRHRCEAAASWAGGRRRGGRLSGHPGRKVQSSRNR